MVRFCWNLTGHLLETIAAYQFELPVLRTVVLLDRVISPMDWDQ